MLAFILPILPAKELNAHSNRPTTHQIKLEKVKKYVETHKKKKSKLNTHKFSFAILNSRNPALLLAIAKTESNFDPTAKSSAGAKGIFQIMRPQVADQHNYELVIKDAERVLDEKLKIAKGDKWLAVERYNGRGREARLYRQKVQKEYNKIKLALN